MTVYEAVYADILHDIYLT